MKAALEMEFRGSLLIYSDDEVMSANSEVIAC